MSIPNTSSSQSGSIAILLAISIPLMVGVAGFLGFIASSVMPMPPSADHFELHQRLSEARSGSPSVEEGRILDRAAAKLEAARQVIEHESEKSWQFRSYDRARHLLWQAERSLDKATDVSL